MQKIVVGMCVCYLFLHGTLVIHKQTDTQTDTKNLQPTISCLKYKISKFLCKSTSCEGDRNDAEKDTIYADSDDDKQKIKQGDKHPMRTLV